MSALDFNTRAFEASMFHPDLPGGKGPGSIRIEPGRMRFTAREDPDCTVELPFQGLSMRLGGAADRIVFFSHPDLPGISVYTSDHTVLDHPAFASQAGVAEQVRGVRRRKLRIRTGSAAVVASIAVVIAGLVLAKDPLVGLVAAQVPPSGEVKLGELVFNQIRASTRLIQDAELDAMLDEMAAPLLASIPETGYAFELHLAEDATLNAFAIPGGNVVLHSGLVLEAESAEEVLGVLAHEIAHVTRRHSLRQMIDTAGVYVLFQMLFGDTTGLAAVLADGGMQLLTLEFSRDHELDADSAGFDYMLAAGVDPRGMISFFKKLQAEQERLTEEAGGIGIELGFLSTHPATEERIETLTRRLAEAGAPADAGFAGFAETFDFKAFQDMLSGTIANHDAGLKPAHDAGD